MAFTFVDNVEQDFASRGWLDGSSLFQRNFRAAGRQWGARLASDIELNVVVMAVRDIPALGGVPILGRALGTFQGRTLYEHGPLSKILTGTNPGALHCFPWGSTIPCANADVAVRVNVASIDANYWLDPNPELRTDPVPPGRTDLVTVAMHEMGHSLGVGGWRSKTPGTTYGQFQPAFVNVFDTLTYFGGNGDLTDPTGAPNPMFYAGPETTFAYGQPAPLTNVPETSPRVASNFTHLGFCDDPPAITGTLMNGCSFPGPRFNITEIDLAVLADEGYPLNGVYYPSSGDLLFGINMGGSVLSVRLKVNTSDALLEPKGYVDSRRAFADTSYNSATGMLTLPAVVVAESGGPSTYSVDLLLDGTGDPIRFVATRAELNP